MNVLSREYRYFIEGFLKKIHQFWRFSCQKARGRRVVESLSTEYSTDFIYNTHLDLISQLVEIWELFR